MMIEPIKAKELQSIPASIPASTPLKPSFRGEEPQDSVEISEEAKEAAAQPKKTISAEDIKNKSDQITQGMEAVADGIDSAANSATSAATKVTGAFTLIGATISKLVPNCVKDFFAKPKVNSETGEFVMKKLADGREVVERTFNKKNTLIAAGVAAAIAITMAVVKHFKNKANAPKAPAAQKIEA